MIGSPYQADMFTTITKAIAGYMGKEYGAAMRILVLNQREQRLTKPRQPIPKDDENIVISISNCI